MSRYHRPNPPARRAVRPSAIGPPVALTTVVLILAVAATPAGASWRARADSLFAEADALYEACDLDGAVDYYERTIEVIESNAEPAPGSYFASLSARARFLLARSHEQLEDWDEATKNYTTCLSELSEVGDLVRLRLAACHAGAGDYEAAVNELRVVIDDGVDGQFDSEAVYNLASYYDDADAPDMALQWYTVYLRGASSYEDRALAYYRIGRAYERRGDAEAATRSYAVGVDDFPRSPHSYDALLRARKISRSFTDRYHQGLVLYNRGRYESAVEFFTWYIRHDRDKEFAHEANYFLGRGHQRLGNFRTAARRYEDALSFGPDSEYFDLAWSKLAYCRRASGKLDASLKVYEDYLTSYPERDAAPDILWEKARLLEEKQRWEEAGAEFSRLAGAYPLSDRAADALFRAGLCLFKRGKLRAASAIFAAAYLGADGEVAGRALFWSGKCREALYGDEDAAQAYVEATEVAPDSYYGARARAWLRERGIRTHAASAPSGASPGGPGLRNGARRPWRSAVWDAEALEFAAWLAEWYDEVYVPNARAALRKSIRAEPAFQRADVLLAIHMRDAALTELADLVDQVGRDPRALDILVDYCERTGLHKRAILLAERILAISPEEGISRTPVYLQKRICPLHFRDIVERECKARGVDVSIELSLIRQESLFEPAAVSWVGACGLSQIMPVTGYEVARRLGVRGHRTSNLLDPATNIRFGTEYLATLLERFDGDIMRALAAYNGGPEAAERWWEYGGGGDVDVFVEDVGYDQTADYVRRVFQYSEIYRNLYGTP
jgi:soluble lytic murein transglycosylase